jgi:hypothetical protein
MMKPDLSLLVPAHTENAVPALRGTVSSPGPQRGRDGVCPTSGILE